MFLKRIEMQGFKSFADKTIVNFNDDVVGVVGPNGCGKSNISDSVRWVLGEQSAKSMRGSHMSDVIFSGSEKRKGVNFAEVKLIFDNSKRTFDVPYDEVELSRRISRLNNENEYFINKSPCRLKDITNLILDTGLGRDSLSIISQGNVSSFADAKPSERRIFFEEAAGVAKYKKRKNEALTKFERSRDNLTRLNDIVAELGNQYNPLKRQAKKAKIYLEKKNELVEIEVSVLVNEIFTLNSKLEVLNQELLNLESESAVKEAQISVFENSNMTEKTNLKVLDREIDKNSSEILHITQNIQIHEAKKSEIEQKREINIFTDGDTLEFQRLQLAYQETEIELKDRIKRLDNLNASVALSDKNLEDIKERLLEIELEYNTKSELLRKQETELNFLKQTKNNPFASHYGVKAVINNRALSGIIGVVADLINPVEGYEQAIEVALGGAMFNIVTDDQDSARVAVQYLKSNSGGRATFLPINVVKERILEHNILTVAESCDGFLGLASEFVNSDEVSDILRYGLLNNIIIVDNLINANKLAVMIKFKTKIVTIDGEVVHKGGSITGGKNKDGASLLSLEKQINDLTIRVDNLRQQTSNLLLEVNDLRAKQSKINEELLEGKLNIAQVSPVIEAKKAKLTKLSYDIETSEGNEQSISLDSAGKQIIEKLNSFYGKRDEINNRLSKDRSTRSALSKDIESKENQIRLLRRELSEVNIKIKSISVEMATFKANIDNALFRLNSDYQMSYETALTQAKEVDQGAKDKANLLRHEIQALGNVNLEAPEEFERVSERYETLTKEVEQLESSIKELLDFMDETDKKMVERFFTKFNEINAVLPGVFAQLFGGGKAKLVLENPDDILNSGVDIDIQPPGKSVKNIRLFSGGEKSMIALSVLFSILKVSPIPLCILDECEAALDPANVERFARYLKHFADVTQFIVITHRPGTMDKCDSLFGVTMTNNGISQLLRIQLTEALGMIEKEAN